ncbi:unnamed protein product [Thelazia callipaeda]|uniref:Transposase n=1 Tax=Thelazia callipaeda TaxID=103827 RepID=A0A0N5D166_THECL|nr:unnamed protein product [Thelazia callipaeda]
MLRPEHDNHNHLAISRLIIDKVAARGAEAGMTSSARNKQKARDYGRASRMCMVLASASLLLAKRVIWTPLHPCLQHCVLLPAIGHRWPSV